MEKNFRPEFLNRVDDIIVFRSLNKDDLKHIIDIELIEGVQAAQGEEPDARLTDEAKELLIEKGTSLDYGARPLRRAIEHYLEDPLAERIAARHFHGKDTITVKVHTVDGEEKVYFEMTDLPPVEQPPVDEAVTTESKS